MSALNISLGGLQGASSRFENAAQRVVRNGAAASERVAGAASPVGPGVDSAAEPGLSGENTPAGLLNDDTVAALVDLKQSEIDYKANAQVAGRVSDLYKETLDILGGRKDT